MERGPGPRSRDARPAGPGPADAQARRDRTRDVLPQVGPYEAGDADQRSARLALVRSVGRGRTARHRCAARHDRPAQRGHRLSGTPVRAGAPVRGDPDPLEGGHLDAVAARIASAACARLHGRGVRIRATHGGTSCQEADPHHSQTGACLWRGHGARHPEPGRPRLQGDLERRNLDDRSAPDRARQGATPRGHDLGRRRGRRRPDRRDHQRARQARVRAASDRDGTAVGVHDALGHVVPGWAAHQRAARLAARRRASW